MGTAAQQGSLEEEGVTCTSQKASNSWGFLSSLPGHLVRALRAAENGVTSSSVTVSFLRKDKAGVGCQGLEETRFLVDLLHVLGAARRLKVCL